MKELKYEPSNIDKYLENERYHHSEKGCEVEFLYITSNCNRRSVIKRCLTHNVVCSKSGWQMGWYQGTESKLLPDDGQEVIVCQCGNKHLNNKKCNVCL